MRRAVNVLVMLLIFLIGGGLGLVFVGRLREMQGRVECKNHLRSIAVGLLWFHSSFDRLPCGTVPNSELPPEKRLSWYVGAWGTVGDGQLHLYMDRTKAWDDEANRDPLISGMDLPKEPLDHVLDWLCPANPNRSPAGMAGQTHSVGIAGVGLEAATLPRDYPGMGIFGYEPCVTRADDSGLGIRLQDIKDGTSMTLILAETALVNGPWTAGGPSTVRGLDPNSQPYLGKGCQFGGTHTDGGMVAFADGSARFLRDNLDGQVFEALATIAGGEHVGDVGDE
jgi:prepilin-type processing-associated H-X9-DG protein